MLKSVEVAQFPGQGVQEDIPRIRDFIVQHSAAMETVAEADELIEKRLGRKVVELALVNAVDFTDAEIIQATIFTVEVAMYRAVEAAGLEPKLVVGHSLGEYAALVAANVLSFEEGLQLVIIRAQAMVEANKETPGGGGMAAISGLSENEVINISREEGVEIANINSPTQTVVSGIRNHIQTVAEKLEPIRGVKATVLNIPYAAHSSYMESAAEKLREVISEFNFKKPSIPMLSNRVETLRLPEQFRRHLPEQLITGVNWHPQMLHTVNELKYRFFAEVGPGKTLSKLLKRNFGDHVEVVPVTETSQ